MGAWAIIFQILLWVTAIFLILLVLIQRGRGGGLAGAFGGMGGQSAFGTKAGDVFTRITIVVATIWILLCIAAYGCLNPGAESFKGENFGAGRAPAPAATMPATTDEAAKTGTSPAVDKAADATAPTSTPAPDTTPAASSESAKTTEPAKTSPSDSPNP